MKKNNKDFYTVLLYAVLYAAEQTPVVSEESRTVINVARKYLSMIDDEAIWDMEEAVTKALTGYWSTEKSYELWDEFKLELMNEESRRHFLNYGA